LFVEDAVDVFFEADAAEKIFGIEAFIDIGAIFAVPRMYNTLAIVALYP
jgi:hypothetical protein